MMHLHSSRGHLVVAVTLSILIGFVPSVVAQDDFAIFPISQVRTTGMVGITAGDSVRLNVLNPGAPAPFLGPICFVQLSLVDDQNNELNRGIFRVLPGHAASLTLNADTDVTLGSDGRLEIRGVLAVPPLLYPPPPDVLPIPVNGLCSFVGTLEIVNNDNARTRVVLPEFRVTFPLRVPAPQAATPNP